MLGCLGKLIKGLALASLLGSTFAVAEEEPASQDVSATRVAGGDTVYKWKDKDGTWHFSQQAPTDTNVQTVIYPAADSAAKAPETGSTDASANPSADTTAQAPAEKNDSSAGKDAATQSHDDAQEDSEPKKKKRKLIMPSSANKSTPTVVVHEEDPYEAKRQNWIREQNNYNEAMRRGMELERQRAAEEEASRIRSMNAKPAANGGIMLGGGGLQNSGGGGLQKSGGGDFRKPIVDQAHKSGGGKGAMGLGPTDCAVDCK